MVVELPDVFTDSAGGGVGEGSGVGEGDGVGEGEGVGDGEGDGEGDGAGATGLSKTLTEHVPEC